MQVSIPKINLEGGSSPHFFEVRLDLFDGPIDLLLHLVKQNELPLEKISLAQVATQYSACIEKMQQFDLEVAGEYLVIAATLLSIKSSLLLQEPVELVSDEEGNLIDPHEELLRRLREAEIYKEGARDLGSRDILGLDVFSGPGERLEKGQIPVRFEAHDAFLLGRAFKKVLERLGTEVPVLKISLEQVSIVDRMVHLLNALKKEGHALSFTTLVGPVRTVATVVATFIALLELCKRQVIQVRQDEVFNEIQISLASETAIEDMARTGLVSEFDGNEDSALQEEGVLANG